MTTPCIQMGVTNNHDIPNLYPTGCMGLTQAGKCLDLPHLVQMCEDVCNSPCTLCNIASCAQAPLQGSPGLMMIDPCLARKAQGTSHVHVLFGESGLYAN